ncbi:MAG: aldo/keto reductase family protein [Spirochaetes bacterium]|jgi:voltage-dependent potassium channel beta subunit|nr:aldo/keto reductase family protein [Spirochaetota bacterium]
MEYRRLGRSGLKVSEIAYGSWLTFANQVELDNGKEIVTRALELGVNYIDTADVYANGAAENLLGNILPQFNRSQIVVATKAFWPMTDAPTDRGLSRKHVTDSLLASLERLHLDYVDIFYCHRYDEETPLEETIEAIDDLIRRGKTLYWGTSEWSAEQIATAFQICSQRGWHPPVVNQPNYSLVVRGIEKEILPTCNALGMGTANFSPLAQGVLTGKYSGGAVPEGSRGSNDELNMHMKHTLSDTDLLASVDKLKPIAEKYGLNTAQLSLAWILQNQAISSVIIGASSVSQLENNVKASGVVLKREDLALIDSLF